MKRQSPVKRTTQQMKAHRYTVWGLLLHRNVQRFRGGLVVKAVRLCVSLNSRRESNKEERRGWGLRVTADEAPEASEEDHAAPGRACRV